MDNSSTPLADYFWIAGIENISYGDSSLPSPNFDQTITEDGEGESASKEKDARSTPTASARHSRHNSASRFSKVSQDGTFHLNFSHLEDDGNTLSNRSSATIRLVPPVNSSASQNGNPNGVPEFDFDKALLKFASEREVFLDDLTFSAGAKLQTRPPMVNPRTERIKADEAESGRKSPLKSIKGSIRRKISFRDMNSMRRQPTAPRPACEFG